MASRRAMPAAAPAVIPASFSKSVIGGGSLQVATLERVHGEVRRARGQRHVGE
jgi:hypothetical protein